MNRIYLFASMCLLIFASCGRSKQLTGVEQIFVDLSGDKLKEGKFAFSEFDFVKLEFSENSLLHNIDKVIPYKDKLYVLSSEDPTVFIFSTEGKYLSNINRGQGPDEVISVNDIDVYNDTLYVFDLYRTIKKYDLNGEYIGVEFKFEHPFFSMKHVDGGLLLFDPNMNKQSDFNLHYISHNKEVEYFPKNKLLKNANFLYYNFCKNDYIAWPLCDTIYQMKDDKPMAEYVVKFNGNSFYNHNFEEPLTPMTLCDFNQDQNFMRWIKDVMCYESKVFFAFNYDHTYFVKYSDDDVCIYPNFIEGLPQMSQSAVGILNDKLIYTYSADKLLEYKNEHTINGTQLNSLYQTISSEEDNPVLIFVKP